MSFEQILKFLDGKKAIIVGVVLTITSYLASQDVITGELANLISTLITIIFGYAEVKTPGVLGRRQR